MDGDWQIVSCNHILSVFTFKHIVLPFCFIAVSGDGSHNSAEDEEDDQSYSYLWAL